MPNPPKMHGEIAYLDTIYIQDNHIELWCLYGPWSK